MAIKKQVVGGQVNCPKCQKLILLPSESPLPRKQEDQPPFQSGMTYDVAEITRAIGISVEPYRRDLETKSNLMNDAVEMVKVRNDRIKEIETLMLNTQKDLWALEVEHEEQSEECKRIYSELHRVRQLEPGKPLAAPKKEDTQEELETLRQNLEILEEKKDKLKGRLHNMVTHSENLDHQLKHALSVLQHDGPLFPLLTSLEAQFRQQVGEAHKKQVDLDHARDYLQQACQQLLRLHHNVAESDRKRIEMEELVHSSAQDMHLAVEERNQWRKQSEELEKKLDGLRESVSTMDVQLSEMGKLKEEWEQDKDLSKRLQAELEDNLELLRKRIELERDQHQQQLAEKELKLKETSQKKIESLELKLRQAHDDLNETEAKLETSLHTQHQ
ncbi:MAG: hypothetical protein PF795_12945 [Kiritimatiellae bacterium]|nr:hypothetical protein [Kiritimatiellia bacterium]